MICGLPLSPLSATDSEGAAGGVAVDEFVDMKGAVTNDPIVGTESVTLTEHGPGARVPTALPSPQRMTPADEARHWLTYAVSPWMRTMCSMSEA